jgi:hypothetical protein
MLTSPQGTQNIASKIIGGQHVASISDTHWILAVSDSFDICTTITFNHGGALVRKATVKAFVGYIALHLLAVSQKVH